MRLPVLTIACLLAAAPQVRADIAPPPAARTAAAPRAIELPSGLRYLDLRVGTGAVVPRQAQVLVHYQGRLSDGTVIDDSRPRGQPARFRIGEGQLILGWEEGVPGMRVGGIRRLVIPPALGYGEGGSGRIPPHSTLVFDIELIATEPPPAR